MVGGERVAQWLVPIGITCTIHKCAGYLFPSNPSIFQRFTSKCDSFFAWHYAEGSLGFVRSLRIIFRNRCSENELV